jgi:predicted amidohydrolase YtcJ
MKRYILILTLFSLVSCLKGQNYVDSIITDATIYTVNNSFDRSTVAVKDGKIVAIGTNDEIRNKFKSNTTINAKGKFIYQV